MNTLDIILLVPLLWGLIRGFLNGLIIQLASIAGIILGVVAGNYFSTYLAKIISPHVDSTPATIKIISFSILFIGVLIGIFFLGKIMEKAIKLAALGWLDKIGGAIFGAIKMIIITGVMLHLFNSIKFLNTPTVIKQKKESKVYSVYTNLLAQVLPHLR